MPETPYEEFERGAQQISARITMMTRQHARGAATSNLVHYRTAFGPSRNLPTDELAPLERATRYMRLERSRLRPRAAEA
jgi:hypothetical protein